MIGFWLLAALMVVAALAFVLTPLLRDARHASPPVDRRLRALDEALAAGVITAEEHATKRAAIVSSNDANAPATAMPSRAAFVATLAIALIVPAAAFTLYRTLGEPRALDPAAVAARAPTADHGPEMDQAIAGLAARLQQTPEDVEGWALLGRAYQTTERFAEARDAFKHAFDLAPDEPDLAIEYAQALALSSQTRRIEGESRDLIEHALAKDPTHQRGLWLLGVSDFQAARYDAAIASWNRLLPTLPKDSEIAKSVQTQIADARKRGGTGPVVEAGTAVPPEALAANDDTANGAATAMPNRTNAANADRPSNAAATTSAAADAPHLTVRVSLDPALTAKLDPSATLFVFARASNGPPMPLAIQRMTASKLPITVTLDESMGMLPTMKLSMFPQVVIGARVSKSGNAMPQSGDLQVLSAPTDVRKREPIELVISQIVP